MLLLLWLALTSKTTNPWVPADSGDQSCGISAHRHAYLTDEQGRYVVNHEKGEPDIVFDGLCHDNDTEKLVNNPARKVLPVPTV